MKSNRRCQTETAAELDTLHLFDNSSAVPRLIFKDESGQTTISDAVLYAELRRQFEP